MSDTPRMDDIWGRHVGDDFGFEDHSGHLYLEGRNLERELAETKEQLRLCNIDQFTTAAELAAEKEWVRQSTNSNARLEKFLAEAQAEVVRLKGEIDELRAALAETQMPTKICGPNLVGILNAAGFYRKKEWVGLTDEEIDEIGRVVIGFNSLSGWENEFGLAIETKLLEKNDEHI